jgi:hypothetical protein
MNRQFYQILGLLFLFLVPLSTRAADSHTDFFKTNIVGCEGVTIVGGAGSITVSGLGSYSHIQVFTPGFAAQVFDREITTPTLTIPITTAGNYIVKIWSNPNPTAFCEENFPVTVGGGGGTPPVANPDNATTPQGQPVNIDVVGNDQPNGTLQMIMLVTNPANGTLIANATGFSYAPNAGFTGTDQFTYKIVTSSGTSNTTTVTVVVTPVANPPVANPDNATTPQEQAVSIAVLTNDNVNGALQNIMLQSSPANGSVILSGNNFVYTPAAGFSGTDQFTYSITTANGTSNTTTVTIVVTPVNPCDNDVTPPTLVGCPSATVTVTAALNATCATATYGPISATDNCSTPTVTRVVGLASGSCFPIGTTLVKYMATDAKGNTATCVFNVVVNPPADPCANDVTPPTISCPTDITKDVTGMSGTCWTINYANATATDNCSTPSVVRESGLASGSCFAIGTHYVVFKATDAKGNVSRCTLTVKIVKNDPCANDVTPPTISCPTDITKDVTGMSGTTWLINYNNPTYSDNCSAVTCVRESGPASGSWLAIGTHYVVFKATDAKGNVSRCTLTIKIIKNDPCANDVTPPTINCPTNITKDVTGMSGTTWLINYNNPTYSDNCSAVTCVRESGPVSGSWLAIGTHYVVFKANDAKGNVSRCTLTIKIIKNVTTCPVNISFWNFTGCAVDLYWNNNGTRVWYKKILPWAWHTQSTYNGHQWLMCNSSGTVLSTCNVNSCTTYTHKLSSCSIFGWLAQGSETFTAQANAEPTRSRIEWVSNTGAKNDFFTVEKLNLTTGDFDVLQKLSSKNSDEVEHYTAFDESPTEGENIYRVKVTYNNGDTKTTDLLKTTFSGLNSLRIFPNPASESIEVDVRAYKGADVGIYLFNAFGQQVHFQNVEKVASNTVTIDISTQSVGNYVVRLASKGKRDAIQKINVVR